MRHRTRAARHGGPPWLTPRLRSSGILALKAAAERLRDEFAPVLGVETVERVLETSYEQFGDRVTTTAFLPVMAERFARRSAAWSGGSEPGTEVDPAAVAAMAEVGIDIAHEFPKPWTDEIVRAADVVVTMGCGDACPLVPGKRYEDWELDDPEGLDLTAVRPIRAVPTTAPRTEAVTRRVMASRTGSRHRGR